MREYELIFDEALKNGLSPDNRLPPNSQVLLECRGFKCGAIGLEPYIELENPLPSTLDVSYEWPFPQFLTGEKFNILVVRDSFDASDKVYSVSDDHQTANLIFDIDEHTYGLGTLMELADFGEYAFMTNGVIMIYWDPNVGDWVETTSHSKIPMMRTICNFKGQAIGGCVVSSWYDCDETFYVWSKIGEMDFTPDRRNEAGYRRCPFGGEVYNVRRLGDNVVGYSSRGITLLTPVTAPAATFGFKELLDVGLVNRGAVNGNLWRQVFVGEDYILREITNDGVKELGYQYYMEQLADEDITVCYDPSEGDFYIGNSSRTFLLSRYGLSEIKQHPSAVWRRNNQTYALPDSVDDVDNLIVTWPFNFGYGGRKTLFTVETDASGYTDGYAAVDYYSINGWKTSGLARLNDSGSARKVVTSDMFRLRLIFGSLDDDFTVGYIKTRYKMTDMRFIRGIYAPPPRGQ